MSVLCIFVTWVVLDFVIHGLLLYDDYQLTSQLWRPLLEMNMGLTYAVTMVGALVFVLIFDNFFEFKNKSTALQYGLLFGLATGMFMGFGSYAVMPITFTMAFVWFLGAVVKAIIAGMFLAMIIGDVKKV